MSFRTELSPTESLAVFRDCVVPKGQEQADDISVPNIISEGFTSYRATKIKQNHAKIASMASQMTRKSKTITGDSFSNAGLDYHDDTWAPSKMSQQQMVHLGVAAGVIASLGARDSWPKGVPIIKVLVDLDGSFHPERA
jgi:hypothetical protein